MSGLVRVIIYGTFDLFHVGHLRILQRARGLGDELFVGISTDTFNSIKGKESTICFKHRMEIISALECVTHVFPEEDWDQKEKDIKRFQINKFVMGDDWKGKFDMLGSICDVLYLSRTPGISSSLLKAETPALKQRITGDGA